MIMQMLQVGYQDHDVALGSVWGCWMVGWGAQRGWQKVNYLLWCLGSKLSLRVGFDGVTGRGYCWLTSTIVISPYGPRNLGSPST